MTNWKKILIGGILLASAFVYFKNDNAINNYNLGLKHMNGEGVAQDKFKAADFFEKSCKSGIANACNNLGVIYETKSGVLKRGQDEDYIKAFGYFEKACVGGDALGCKNIAALYLDGRGTTQDTIKAVKYYQKACDGKVAWGCHMLGYIYENDKNLVVAKEYYRKACELDSELLFSCQKYNEL